MQNWLDKLPDRWPRRPLCTLALGAIVLSMLITLVLPSAAQAASIKITPHIANHTPIVNKKWPIRLTITKGKAKLSGTIKYEFLFEGSVVSTQPKHGAYKFKGGVYRDQLLFPAQSLGQPLTLRFVVRTRHGSGHVDWKLETKQATSTTAAPTTTTT